MSKELWEKLGQEGNQYGDVLKENVRWGSYKPEWMGKREWVHILGEDSCNYLHMGYMAGLTRQYIDRTVGWGYELSHEDRELLMDTAYIHDFAEAIDGDVPDTEKVFDKETFAQERTSLIKVLGSVATDAVFLADRVLPVMQGKSVLAHHWRAIEVIGYAETAKKAGEQLNNLDGLVDELWFPPNELADVKTALEGVYATRERTHKHLKEFKFLPAVAEYLLDSEP